MVAIVLVFTVLAGVVLVYQVKTQRKHHVDLL